MHVLTNVIHIGATTDKILDDLRVTIPTCPCQCRVPIVVFKCTSKHVNGRCEICIHTSVVHVSAVGDEMLDNFRVTAPTGHC